MYAIVEISGKQYKIAKDDKLEVDKLGKDKGKISFDKVLLYAKDENNVEIGSPYVVGATVDAEILENKRGEKIRVFKMKAKKRYSRTIGHRRELSVIQISDIKVSGAKKPAAKASATETSMPEEAKVSEQKMTEKKTTNVKNKTKE